jgi:hypothetical protein
MSMSNNSFYGNGEDLHLHTSAAFFFLFPYTSHLPFIHTHADVIIKPFGSMFSNVFKKLFSFAIPENPTEFPPPK